MRDFFIRSLEMVINVIVVIAAIGIVIAAVMALLNGNAMGVNPIVGFVGILIGGALYLIVMAGFMYLGLGIYQNTKRTADALERGAPLR